ncbi:DUF6894 family protein [Microvirga makkahensis]|uniref:DUF6894 domain-containing protein n=1 Tax=Microvirga makkahensis TaxID=1128670 RepID=A0A7X3SQY0_9HYPH|nr:hypothetical protein [Microvirga makkahensis]MXQ13594.1 hypothetical protein [Microvirga makkahensis]
MQRYYFHITDGRRLYLDPTGFTLSCPAAARRHAIEDARCLLESWMARSTLPWRLEVHDSSGTLVCSVSLAEAAVSEARPLFHDEVDQAVWFEGNVETCIA